MDYQAFKSMLEKGKEQHYALLAEASGLLRDLDVCGLEDYELIIARRSEIINGILEIDRCRVNYMESLGGEELGSFLSQTLNEFDTLQQTTIRKVLELDALVIGLAGGCLDSLRGELTTVSRGMAAFAGYERSGATVRSDINEVA